MEMNEHTNITVNSELSVNFVQSGYFLNRVHEFEAKYSDQWENWLEFLAEYRCRNNSVDFGNSDFDEWAFLCEHFMPDLLRQDPDRSPPDADISSRRPEIDSGLCFWRSAYWLTSKNISIWSYEKLPCAAATQRFHMMAQTSLSIGSTGP